MPKLKTLMRVLVAGAAIAATPAVIADTIVYSGWLGTYDYSAPLVRKMQDEFKKKTGSELKVMDTAFDKVLNQATVTTLAGNPADALHLMAVWVPALQSIGGLEPLDEYFSKEKIESIPKAMRDAVSFDGKLYALPWVPGPILPHYNRDLMKQAGLNPDKYPETWPELMNLIKKICALPDKDGAKIYGVALRTSQNPNSAQWAIPVIYGHGGDIVQNGTVKFNSPETQAAFKWIQELANSGCTPVGHSHSESRNTFAAGRAGVILEGPWGRGLVETMSGKKMKVAPDGNVWVAPIPKAPDGTRKTIGNPQQIAISSKSKNKKLAAAFLDMLIFDESNTTMYYDLSSQLATSSTPLLKKGAVGADAYSQIFVGALDYTNDNPWKSPRFNAVMSALAPEMQNIVKGGDIPKALSAADTATTRLLSR